MVKGPPQKTITFVAKTKTSPPCGGGDDGGGGSCLLCAVVVGAGCGGGSGGVCFLEPGGEICQLSQETDFAVRLQFTPRIPKTSRTLSATRH